MKGPYERLKYDLRRLWQCPECGRREWTGGETTYRFCRCQRKQKPTEARPMKLIADGCRRVG